MPTSDTAVAIKRQELHCEEVWIQCGESESGRLRRIQMNGIWRNDTVTYEGLQEPPPVATALLFLGWEGGSKLQHREPQTRRTSGSRAAKSPASSELLAYPWRWLALACSCHTAYVRTLAWPQLSPIAKSYSELGVGLGYWTLDAHLQNGTLELPAK